MSGARHNGEEPPFDAIVAVGSQGALPVFRTIASCLLAELPAAVVLDLHRREDSSFVEDMLVRECPLPVLEARGGLMLEPGTVYVAPANRQLLVDGDRSLGVAAGATEGPGHRHADALLASAAHVFGPRLIAIVLSGRLDGGAAGIQAAKRRGARVLVQEPATADAPSMPQAALATGCVDFALPPESLGQALVALTSAAGAAELFRVRLNVGVLG